MKNRKWVLWASIVLVLIGLMGTLITEWQSQDLHNYLAGLEARFTQLDERFDLAVNEIAEEAGNFAAHWSSVPQQDVRRLEGYFAEVSELLTQANSVKTSDWDQARSAGQLAESRIAEMERFCDGMLGTVGSLGYYATLQFQTDNIDNLIEELIISITNARALIFSLSRDNWSQSINLNFRVPLSDLSVAETELERLQTAHAINVGDEPDWPTLYRALEESSIRQLVEGARTKANNLYSQSQDADQAIRRAEEIILSTDRYIEQGRYQYHAALDALAEARETLARAYFAFDGNPQLEQLPDFIHAKELAEQAISEANSAYLVASTPTPTPSPTPTPEPTNTPVPVIIIFDDDNSGSGSSGYGYGGSSSPDTGGYPSSDYGSSNYTEPFSSYEDSTSDPWGSNDGFNYNSDPWGDDGF